MSMRLRIRRLEERLGIAKLELGVFDLFDVEEADIERHGSYDAAWQAKLEESAEEDGCRVQDIGVLGVDLATGEGVWIQ